MLTTDLIFQASLFLFHCVTTLFDFSPFNNERSYTRRKRLPKYSVSGVLLTIPFAGFAFRIGWIEMAALVVYPVLLLGQYLNWWHH